MILLLLGENSKENLLREEEGRPVRRLEWFSNGDAMVVCPKTVTVRMVRSEFTWKMSEVILLKIEHGWDIGGW